MSDMTGRSTQESDDIDSDLGIAATVVLVAAVLGWAILVYAFLFKVWNERQMTHAYDRQAVAQERIADALEGKALKKPKTERDELARLNPKGFAFADCILAIPKDTAITETEIDRCSK